MSSMLHIEFVVFPMCAIYIFLFIYVTTFMDHCQIYRDGKVCEMECTLLTRMVPARPRRPAMPRGGGRAQSSPTITVYKYINMHTFILLFIDLY